MAPSPLLPVHRTAGATVVERTFGGPEAASAPVVSAYPSSPTWPESGVVCVDLAHLPTFELVGEDVRRWTNGMFTNNTRRLQPGQGNRHCACDDRGRVRGVLDLYLVAEDRVRLVLDGMAEDAFVTRYQMYLMLDDIEIERSEPPRVVLTVQGEGTDALLAGLGLPVPEADHAHLEAEAPHEGVRVCRRDRSGRGGVDLLVPEPSLARLWAALVDAGAAPHGLDQLDALRVVAVRAAFPTDATDKSMVHELRLEGECCAFDKGCYVGQEVINRIDVKGAIQKRLTGMLLDGPVPVGAEVRLGEKVVGRLTAHARVEGRDVAVGVLRKTAWAPGTELSVVAADGTTTRATVGDAPLVRLG